mgnify:CR=1 FL=1
MILKDLIIFALQFHNFLAIFLICGNPAKAQQSDTTATDTTLVDKFLEWFGFAGKTDIIEEHTPEAGIDEVPAGMFVTTDIKVDILPVVVGFF